jgi:hypothetical protein
MRDEKALAEDLEGFVVPIDGVSLRGGRSEKGATGDGYMRSSPVEKSSYGRQPLPPADGYPDRLWSLFEVAIRGSSVDFSGGLS